MTQKEIILKILKEKKISQKSIAKALNVNTSTFNRVLNGSARSARIEKAITALTGYEFSDTYKSDEEVKELLKGVI